MDIINAMRGSGDKSLCRQWYDRPWRHRHMKAAAVGVWCLTWRRMSARGRLTISDPRGEGLLLVLLLDDEGRWCWRPMDRAEVPKSEANTRVTVPCAVVLVELHEGCGGWRMGRTRTRGVFTDRGDD